VKTIHLYTEINAGPEICFDLARSVEVHLASTKETNEKAVAGRTTGLCEVGDVITWRAKHFGIYQYLTVKITSLTYPTHFQDKMVKGAFASFTHDHYFHRKGDKTLMEDVFTFSAPLGPLGLLAEWLFLEKYMQKLLIKRNSVIKELAESGEWKQILKQI
jgi:ligand-binding SRPBCC domain-containing protein